MIRTALQLSHYKRLYLPDKEHFQQALQHRYVLPVCENQLIAPTPPALPYLAPIAYCPRISARQVSVRTHVDSTMPVTAIGDAGVMILLHLLMMHRLPYGMPVFLDEVLTEFPNGAGKSQDI